MKILKSFALSFKSVRLKLKSGSMALGNRLPLVRDSNELLKFEPIRNKGESQKFRGKSFVN